MADTAIPKKARPVPLSDGTAKRLSTRQSASATIVRAASTPSGSPIFSG